MNLRVSLSFILISFVFTSLRCQSKLDCNKLLDKELELMKKSPSDSAIRSDLNILINCGDFNEYDKRLLTPPTIGTLLIANFNNKQPVTYRKIIDYINDFKKTEDYKKYVELLKLSDSLENEKFDLKNWEKDKIIFVNLGLSDIEINELYQFFSKPENSGLTYKKGFIAFSEKRKIKAQNYETENKPFFEELRDYDSALKAAPEDRNLIILFSGYSCVNSRKMEDMILLDLSLKTFISENFIPYQVWVDDRKSLSEDKQYISKISGKEIKTVGQKNMELQNSKFNTSHQPYFVIIDKNGKILSSIGYTKNKDEFYEFLKAGMK